MTDEKSDRPGIHHDTASLEAAQWLAKIELGTADENAFETWRAASPAHALAFARVSADWEALGDVATPADAQARKPAARRHVLKSLIAVTVLGSGGALFASRAYAWTTAKTAVGEYRKVRLPDESVLELNTNSEVAWRFEENRRLIWLRRGEMAVTLLPGKPAVLRGKAPLATLQSGTYTARHVGDDVVLTVISGTALIDRPHMAPDVAHDLHQVTMASTGETIRPASHEDVSAMAAWQSGEIIFRDEPLSAAVEEYNRYLVKKIVILDPVVANERVGGRFTTNDPQDFLRALEIAQGLRTLETKDKYVIEKKL